MSGWNIQNSYAALPAVFYSHQVASSVSNPKLVQLNRPLAISLGLDPDQLVSEDGLAIFSGNRVPDGAKPLAQAYAGHQFGHFTMLGDGRALLICEQITPQGKLVDIQLKGSGRTPFSRRGDGLAALGPMLREYVISEAMHGLGIPTTRSLAVVETGDPVYREKELPGAILTRVAASHIRVGTFQYAAQYTMQLRAEQEDGDLSLNPLRELADYTIARHYPALNDIELEQPQQRYLLLLKAVIAKQAALIAKWQCVGFIHGVMNTDNMAISGETIDYGPCAFMDHYDPETVFSSIDTNGRYAYCNQPYIGGWNLARFAESLLLILHDDPKEAIPIAQAAIAGYNDLYHRAWLDGMRAKLGIIPQVENDTKDQELIDRFLTMMHQNKADFTNTFRLLSEGKIKQSAIACHADYEEWYELWQKTLAVQTRSFEESLQLMRQVNPAVIPRNHRVEAALTDAVEKEDQSLLNELLHVLRNPFDLDPNDANYTELPDLDGEPYQTFCGT